jgi:glycosyltransferase involved in cell wall biosynthesis
MEIELSIIIPTKNRNNILAESIQKLSLAVSEESVEIIVVNDGDSPVDKGPKALAIKIIANRHSGVASARNTGAAAASGRILLFMDDDIWFTQKAIGRIIEIHRAQTNIALNVNWVYPDNLKKRLRLHAFGRYLDHYGFSTLKGWARSLGEWQDGHSFKASGITSQNLSMHRNTFIATGGYNEQFPFAGFEDHDFAKRLNAAGVNMIIDPTIMTFHNEADRMSIQEWLDRRYRGAITRRVAVQLGHQDLALHYSILKRALFALVAAVAPALKWFIGLPTAGSHFSDRVKFFFINVLLADAIFRGYVKGHKGQELASNLHNS